MKTTTRILRWVACVAVSSSACPGLAEHAGDLWVGRTTSANPPIAINVGGFDTNNIVVLPPVNGILHGWSNNSPGFDHLVSPIPDRNLYPLEGGANIWLEVIRFDPAFRVIDNGFQVLDQPGERTSLGGPSLHTHLIWHINNQDPQFDPHQWLWTASFRLVDTGATAYSASEPITMYFSNVDCRTGDMNADGSLNLFDIAGFVNALSGNVPIDQKCAADANRDGSVNLFDIDPFVDLLTQP